MASRAPVELDFLGLRPAAACDHDNHRHGSTGSAASSSSIRGLHRVLFLPWSEPIDAAGDY